MLCVSTNSWLAKSKWLITFIFITFGGYTAGKDLALKANANDGASEDGRSVKLQSQRPLNLAASGANRVRLPLREGGSS